MELRIEGRKSDIEAVWREISDENVDFSVNEIKEAADDPLERRPAGIEPLTYFVVVFAAHLAADVAHDIIKEKLSPIAKEKWKKLRTKSKE